MRSLKRTLWVGLIALFALWLVFALLKLLYNFLRPVRDLLFLAIGHRTPGLEFAAAIVLILILGFVVRILGHRASSKIPFINLVFGLTKTINEIAHKVETGEIKIVKAKMTEGLYFLSFTTDEIVEISGEKMILVFRPFTPNLTSGYTYLVSREDIRYLPELRGRALKILLHGWLTKLK
jgi:uncharacterized membrane protein